MLHCGWPASHLLTAYSVLFRATTHNDLQMRAQQEGIQVTVIHNASIMNAVGACGLQLYKYGEVSLQTGVWLRQRAHGLSAYMKSFILTKPVKKWPGCPCRLCPSSFSQKPGDLIAFMIGYWRTQGCAPTHCVCWTSRSKSPLWSPWLVAKWFMSRRGS